MNNLKILVSYHKEATIIKNNILTPIHAGRALNSNEWLEQNMMGDNIGENISIKNDRYCELTVQYYIWKNPKLFNNLDYIGFMHYRRLLNFNLKVKYNESFDGLVKYPFIDDNLEEVFGLSEENINNIVTGYDIITGTPVNTNKLGSEDVYEQYRDSHFIKDYNFVLEILKQKYPEYKNAADEYNKSQFGYFTNSYIMSKEMFNKYSEWLFSILFEAEEQIQKYEDAYQNRTFGFLAERLFGIFLTYQRQNNCKIKELQKVYIENTDISKNYIPIAFSCNNNYTQHLCCAMISIIKNANPNDYYIFYILNSHKNLNFFSKKIISKLKSKNCSINYIEINEKSFDNLPQTLECKHISIETYYRFVLGSLFPLLKKILYLDCDINVTASLEDLFNIDISEYYFGGVEDILYQKAITRLNLSKYCNAGVMLINLEKWRKDNIEDKLFNYAFTFKDEIVWQDQDVLNAVLQDGIKYIDKSWNAQVGEYDCCYDSGFNTIGESAKIIHHIGKSKPWSIGCKSPFIKIYLNYLNLTSWECKYLIYNHKRILGLIILIFITLKEFRKKIIWYRKSKKQLILLNHFIFKFN